LPLAAEVEVSNRPLRGHYRYHLIVGDSAVCGDHEVHAGRHEPVRMQVEDRRPERSSSPVIHI